MSSMNTQWQMTSRIGRMLLPEMQNLAQKLNSIEFAMLCTADGFNLCSLEIDDEDVGKTSTLTSSLFSICSSIVDTMYAQHYPDDKKEILLTIADVQIFVAEVTYHSSDNLVLLVSAKNTSSGKLLMTVRNTVTKLEEQINQLTQKKREQKS